MPEQVGFLVGGGKIPFLDIMREIIVWSSVVSAFIVLFLGQSVTSDWNFHEREGIIRMVHRAAFWCFALSLFYHAKLIVDEVIIPDVTDMYVYASFMTVCVISAIQHRRLTRRDRETEKKKIDERRIENVANPFRPIPR